MSKKIAVLVVNPVNGFGLFQYLESLFENKISFKTFAVSDSVSVKTNSGVALQTDAVIAKLKGHEKDYDALVFACGDAMPTFADNIGKPCNQDLLAVIKAFNKQGKVIVGHCAAAVLFDIADIGEGKRVAVHPFGKPHLQKTIGTDEPFVIDGNLYTAQTEHTISSLMPAVLKAFA
ncbi:protease I [Planctomycetales bacterium]|nr:protease I [Planctomycetales bacterium]